MTEKALNERREKLAAVLGAVNRVTFVGWSRFSFAKYESELGDRLRALRAFGITARTKKEAKKAAAALIRKWDEEAWAAPHREPTEDERRAEAEARERAERERPEREVRTPAPNATWLLGEYRDCLTKHAVLVRHRNKAFADEAERHRVPGLDRELRTLRDEMHRLKDLMTAAGIQAKTIKTPISERLASMAEEERQAVAELERTGDAEAVEKARTWYRQRRSELFEEPVREELDYEA